MKTKISATLLAALLIITPTALAADSRDQILRAEVQVEALNAADAAAASPENYLEAQLRLREAREAGDRRRHEEARRRAAEASLQTEIVQENIKLRGLERTISEIETGIRTLNRELNS